MIPISGREASAAPVLIFFSHSIKNDNHKSNGRDFVQVVTTFYTHQQGWHTPLPALDSPQTLVLVFSEPDVQRYETAISELQAHYPQSLITGCSALAGIVDHKLMENGLLVSILQFQNTTLAITAVKINNMEDSWRAGQHIAKKLQQADLAGLLLFTDGINANSTELLAGINSVIEQKRVNIAGGIASDKMQFEQTWVLYQGKFYTNLACGIGFYGSSFQLRTYAKDGFKPFGPERKVTRAEKNTLYEIDNMPALQLYREYLGENAKNLPHIALNYPFAVWDNDRENYRVRVPIDIDESTQSIKFIADIPDTSSTQLMYGTFDNLIEGAEEAANDLMSTMSTDRPVFVLAISCAARRLILAEDTAQELEATFNRLPPGSQQLGFYSYGELAQHSPNSCCHLHNETMTLTVIYE